MSDDGRKATLTVLPTRRAETKAEMLAMLDDWRSRVEKDEVEAIALVGVNAGKTSHTHTYAAYDKVALVSALEILKVQICNTLLGEEKKR